MKRGVIKLLLHNLFAPLRAMLRPRIVPTRHEVWNV